MTFEKIAVIDFGGQYAHLIARRIREAGVKSEVFPCSFTAEDLKNNELKTDSTIKGIVFSGGPSGVYEQNAPTCDPQILELSVPVLGLCFGHQLIAKLLGGKVEKGEGEYGVAQIELNGQSQYLSIFKGLESEENVWMSHGDSVQTLPEGFKALAHTASCPVAAMGDNQRKIYGVQFHPEV
ncbi:MAG: glutamine-hydrolyzing GMP synthase, partial [Candidatus Diapherotrites archaeon]|nr:glutamine-hydrolyzing GMP synthase [Candidatus Diapherotrites archaeon]